MQSVAISTANLAALTLPRAQLGALELTGALSSSREASHPLPLYPHRTRVIGPRNGFTHILGTFLCSLRSQVVSARVAWPVELVLSGSGRALGAERGKLTSAPKMFTDTARAGQVSPNQSSSSEHSSH